MSQGSENHNEMLAEIRRSQDAVRGRAAKPSWRYDLTYAAIAGLMVGGQVAPFPFNVLASTGGTVAFVVLWRQWTQKTGVSVTGFSRGRQRWVSIALGIVFIALMLTAVDFGHKGQPIWGLPLGAVGFVAALLLSRLWAKVYRDASGAPL